MTHQDQWTELEGLAKAATPGEWRQGELGAPVGGRHCVDFGEPPKAPYMVMLDGNAGTGAMRAYPASGVVHSDDGSSERNAAFIAAANPATVLALIAAARAGSVGIAAGDEPSPPRSISLSGEAVAWRYRPKAAAPHGEWSYRTGAARPGWEEEWWDIQPLYTAPSSQGREGGA